MLSGPCPLRRKKCIKVFRKCLQISIFYLSENVRPLKLKDITARITWALIDQAAISLNALMTVVVGARVLEVPSQALLSVVYLGYVVQSVLIGAYFFAAYSSKEKGFRCESERLNLHEGLRKKSFYVAIMLVPWAPILIAQAPMFSSRPWDASELSLWVLFCFLFQHYEFHRRARYFFGDASQSAKSSLLVLLIRTGGFIVLPIESLADILLLLVASIFIPGIKSIYHYFKFEFSRSSVLPLGFARDASICLMGSLLQLLYLHGPVMVVSSLLSIEALAILVLLRSLANILNPITEMFDTVLPAQFIKVEKGSGLSGKRHLALKIVSVAGVVYTSGLVLLWSIGGLLLDWTFGDEYSSHVNALMVLWFGNLFYLVVRLVRVYLQVAGSFTRDLFVSVGVNLTWAGIFVIFDDLSIFSIACIVSLVPVIYVTTQGLVSLVERERV